MVGDAGAARVHVRAAELLRRHLFSGRRLHERWAADEDRARAADDDRLVRHRRDIGAAGRAGAHHDRDLRDPLGGHPRLVEEDPAEVVAVREHLGLEGKERAARVDEVDAWEVVLLRDLLRTQVLLHGQREVRAALHGRIVRDDDAFAPLDDADPGDDPRRRRLSVVQLPRGEGVQLEERGAGIDEPVDALARGQLAARAVPLDRCLAAARRDERGAVAQLGDERLHRRRPPARTCRRARRWCRAPSCGLQRDEDGTRRDPVADADVDRPDARRRRARSRPAPSSSPRARRAAGATRRARPRPRARRSRCRASAR